MFWRQKSNYVSLSVFYSFIVCWWMCKTEVQVELEEIAVSLCMSGQDVGFDCGLLGFFSLVSFFSQWYNRKKMTTDRKYENEIRHKKFCPFFSSNLVKCSLWHFRCMHHAVGRAHHKQCRWCVSQGKTSRESCHTMMEHLLAPIKRKKEQQIFSYMLFFILNGVMSHRNNICSGGCLLCYRILF